MQGFVKKCLKMAVGAALLPVSAAIDIVTLPLIANDDREASTPKVLRHVVKNVEDIATGKWEEGK